MIDGVRVISISISSVLPFVVVIHRDDYSGCVVVGQHNLIFDRVLARRGSQAPLPDWHAFRRSPSWWRHGAAGSHDDLQV